MEPRISWKLPFPGIETLHWSTRHSGRAYHTRLIVALANLLKQPQIRPRYVASVEDHASSSKEVRIRIGVPVVWVQKTGSGPPTITRGSDRDGDHHPRGRRGPATRGTRALHRDPGPIPRSRSRDRHRAGEPEQQGSRSGPATLTSLKQEEIRGSECHLVEIDLLRRGTHVLSVPESYAAHARPFDYLACVNRWPARNRYELYPCRLRDPLSTIGIPLADPDPDALCHFSGRWSRSITKRTTCSACFTMSPASRRSRRGTRSGPRRSGRPIAGPIPSFSQIRTAAESGLSV